MDTRCDGLAAPLPGHASVRLSLVDRCERTLDAFRSGDNERARELSDEWLAAAQADGDLAGQIDALCMLARVALRKGEFARVRALADEARTRARAAGDQRAERMPMHMQAVSARMTGDIAEARADAFATDSPANSVPMPSAPSTRRVTISLRSRSSTGLMTDDRFGDHYPPTRASWPPSTGSTAPVMNCASSE